MADVCIEVDWLGCMTQDEIDGLDPAMKDRAELFAQTAIKVLTGQQLANCPIEVRPCTVGCVPAGGFELYTEWMVPYISNGVWYNTCGCKPTDCSCTTLTKVILPGPVAEIVEVKVDGTVLAASDYFIAHYNQLIRAAGPEWPSCQDMLAPDSAVGTMSVTYVRGAKMDALGKIVAGVLAKEYLNACNDTDCHLPSNVISLARQGVQMEFGEELFPGGRTGIDSVDLWVQSWNPYHVKAPARVFSPDSKRPFQRTWMT